MDSSALFGLCQYFHLNPHSAVCTHPIFSEFFLVLWILSITWISLRSMSSPVNDDGLGYKSDDDEDYKAPQTPDEPASPKAKKSRKRIRKADSDDDSDNSDEEGEDVENDDGRIADPDEESALKKLEDQEREDSKDLIVGSDDEEVDRSPAKMARKHEKDKRKR